MKILVVAATHAEIAPILSHYQLKVDSFADGGLFDLLITGVGMTATAFALGQQLQRTTYSLVLNLGIAGSFDPHIPLGTVVNVTTDIFSELGAQDNDAFIAIDALGFGRGTFKGAPVAGLPHVQGITVNTVHGDSLKIAEITERLHPQTESMEGASVFYCCEKADIRCLQVRAISNLVAPRNKEHWDIPLAVRNLNSWAINFLTHPIQS